MLDEDSVERAVWFLRDSAEKIGKARGHMVFCDGNLRRVKSLEMIGKEGAVGTKEAEAYASDAYKKALEQLENATADYETVRAQREGAVYLIESWRSQNSARKQGIT